MTKKTLALYQGVKSNFTELEFSMATQEENMADKDIIQLGIQAPPGTIVSFGSSGNTIVIGNTGIFSIEVSDAIVIHGPLNFKLPTINNTTYLENMPVIVDIVYINLVQEETTNG